MVKRFVSVALSVSLVLSMTPFGMKRALADELPQDNPVEYEVPAEEEEVPDPVVASVGAVVLYVTL